MKKLVGLTIIALLLGAPMATAQNPKGTTTGDGSAGPNSPPDSGGIDSGTATGKNPK